MAFWKPDPENPQNIVRAARPADDPAGISEFPHLIVNQARVLDYFAEFAANSPARIRPDYGYEFHGLEVTGEGDHPVEVTLVRTAGELEGQKKRRARQVRASGPTAPAAGCAMRSVRSTSAARPSTPGE